jgi:hypothetical protein
MRAHHLFAAALAAIVSMTVAAAAETMRFPNAGTPAVIIHTPDGWMHMPSGDVSMIFGAANHTASVVLSVTPYTGTPDDLAKGALQVMHAQPPRSAGAVRVSGFPGQAYDSSSVNSSGVHVNVHMVIVRPDGAHIVAIMVITAATISASDHAVADSVLREAQIVGGGK